MSYRYGIFDMACLRGILCLRKKQPSHCASSVVDGSDS